MRCDVRVVAGAIGGMMACTMLAGTRASAQTAYLRYDYAGECMSAMDRLTAWYWRDKRSDTAQYAPDKPSAVPGLRDSLRVCAARLDRSAAAMTDAQASSVLALSYMIGDETLTATATDFILRPSTKRTPVAQATLLRGVVVTLLKVQPVPVTVVETYLRALDDLGPPAGPARLAAHTAVAEYALNVGNLPLAAAQAKSVRTLAQKGQMLPNDQTDWLGALLSGYNLSFRVAQVTSGKEALAYFDSAAADMRKLPDVDPAALQRQLMEWHAVFDKLGKPGPPLRGRYWYGTRGDTSAMPRAGKVTVVMHAPSGAMRAPTSMIAIAQRLRAKYPRPDLELVLVMQTVGRFMNHLEPDPDKEAEMLRHYYIDFLKWSDIFGIEQSKFNTLANGYRMMTAAVNSQSYPHLDRVANIAVVGKDGLIRYIDLLTPESERRLDMVIQETLAK